MVMRQHL